MVNEGLGAGGVRRGKEHAKALRVTLVSCSLFSARALALVRKRHQRFVLSVMTHTFCGQASRPLVLYFRASLAQH